MVKATEKSKENGNERPCSNCGEQTRLDQAVVVTSSSRVVAIICPKCQQAKKIQITLAQKRGQWNFSQYFPIEA